MDNKKITSYYFSEYKIDGVVQENKWKCKCGKVFAQNTKSGYTNLMNHINKEHPESENELNDGNRQSTLVFYSKGETKIFGWMDFIVDENLAFSVVEKKSYRKYTNLGDVSIKTIKKYFKLVYEKVKNKVKLKLPSNFGLIFDGWKEGLYHYVAVFAVYEENGKTVYPLLGFRPIPDDETRKDYSLSAESHEKLFEIILDIYDKNLSNVLFFVGDNCNTNKSLASLCQVPLIGCYSHRFNLEVKNFIVDQECEDLLENINSIMKLLKSTKRAAKLARSTSLLPKKRNVTRWSSSFEMLKRFMDIKEHFDPTDYEVISLLPNPKNELRLQKLLLDLTGLETVTKELQSESTNLLIGRDLFEGVMEKYPSADKYLSSSSKIIHSPRFEDAVYKSLKGDVLGQEEKAILLPYKLDTAVESSNDSKSSTNFAKSILLSKKARISNQYNLGYIPATSNVAERFFSSAKLVITDLRKSMDKESLEFLMFLKTNSTYWDINTVSESIQKQ